MSNSASKAFLTIEVIIVFILGILENKISENLTLPPTTIVVFSIALLLVLVLLTVKKSAIKKDVKETIEKERVRVPKIRITKQRVDRWIQGLIFYPSALFVSAGSFYLAFSMERGLFKWLPAIAVSGTLFLSPWLMRRSIEKGYNKLLPLGIVLLCLIYGGAGDILIFSPTLLDSHFLLFAFLSSFAQVGLQALLTIFWVKDVFDPWYQRLPDR